MAVALVGTPAGAAGSTVTSTTVAVTVPTGSTGDLLLFHAYAACNATSGATAPKFTWHANLTYTHDQHTVYCQSTFLYRVVQAGDPSSYTFTSSSGAPLAVTCTRYSGVQQLRSWNIKANAGDSTEVGTSITLPTTDNVQPNDLVIAAVACGRNAKASSITALNTPTNWTQRKTQTGPVSGTTAFPVTGAQYERLGVNDSPSFTSSTGQWVAHVIVLSPASDPVTDAIGAPPTFVGVATAATVATNLKTITVNKPAGVVDGHLLLLVVSSADGTNVNTPPAGWRHVGLVTASFGVGTTPGADDLHAELWYKWAASEGASYTITTTGNQELAAVVIAYNLARYPWPIDLVGYVCQYASTAAPTTTSPAPYTVPGITADNMVVQIYACGADASGTMTLTGPASGWTQRANVVTAVSGDFNTGIHVTEKQGGTAVPTASNTKACGWGIFTVVLVGSPVPRQGHALAFF